jgi:hypothetical protein
VTPLDEHILGARCSARQKARPERSLPHTQSRPLNLLSPHGFQWLQSGEGQNRSRELESLINPSFSTSICPRPNVGQRLKCTIFSRNRSIGMPCEAVRMTRSVYLVCRRSGVDADIAARCGVNHMHGSARRDINDHALTANDVDTPRTTTMRASDSDTSVPPTDIANERGSRHQTLT